MSVTRLVEWAAAELEASGLSAADVAVAAAHLRTASGHGPVMQAVTMVTTARGVSRLAESARWWSSAEALRPKERLLAGEADCAWTAVAERLAEPAEDCWDPNWPPQKVAWALLPPGGTRGDSFVVGNGEGERARVELAERDGQLVAVLTASRGPLDEVWDDAMAQAKALLAS